jgi:LPS export ABC transporter protein LptC
MRVNGKKTDIILMRFRPLLVSAAFVMAACSFEYDPPPQEDNDPDLVMKAAEYVRIESGNPVVRVRADELRRYEKTHIMELDLFYFDQFNSAQEDIEQIPDINVLGNAGKARIETDTNNLSMENGVYVEVKSEDIILETREMTWQDKEHHLTAPGKVTISRSDGTTMEGEGFTADTRQKSWEFEKDVEGAIVDDK